MNKKYIFTIWLLILLLILPVNNDSLSTANFVNSVVTTSVYAKPNSVGLSMYLQDTYHLFGNTLFQHYINNSLFYGYFINSFYQSYHVPVGYKYNCSASIYNVTNSSLINCTVDLSSNTTILSQMSNFFYNFGDYYATDLGWDLQKANFSNKTGAYFKNFKTYENLFFNSRINV